MPALVTVDHGRAVAEAELAAHVAVALTASLLEGASLAQLRLQGRPDLEERGQGLLPGSKEGGVDVAAQALAGIGDVPDRAQGVLLHLLRHRPRDGGQPAAEVVQEAEADPAQGIRAAASVVGSLHLPTPALPRAAPAHVAHARLTPIDHGGWRPPR